MTPEVSIVVPVFNEAEAAPALAHEIMAAFAGWAVEILFVDDASTDGTAAVLAAVSGVTVLRHARNAGQSRAIRSGVLAARAPVIVTLDGDGQNDPADAPKLAAALAAGPSAVGMVAGERRQRQDTASKRWASRLANGLRRRILADGAADTGCGLKAFRREVYLRLPYFDHQHRYLPALVKREGYAVAFRPVNHRPRLAGVSKYSNLGRLWVGLSDLAGVAWLMRRARDPGAISSVQQDEP